MSLAKQLRSKERSAAKKLRAATENERARKRSPRSKLVAQGAVEKSALPTVELARATLVKAVPEGDEYLHELKYDGYRISARVEHGVVKLLTRYGNDWSERFPELARAVLALPVESAIFDGEVIARSEHAGGDFQKLQNVLKDGSSGELCYVLFDLLYLDGLDLRPVPLESRKKELASLLARRSRGAPLDFGGHVIGGGPSFFEQTRERGVEGVVSKRRGAAYGAGDWLKTKYSARQEFVVVGYTDPAGSREHFGALLLGLNEQGKLRYAGKVGTGFSAASLREIYGRMKPLLVKQPALADPPTGAEARGAHWLAPELVAEIEFTELTRDGRARHPTFKGLRDDKPADVVEPERPKDELPARRGAPPQARAHPTFALSHPEKLLYPAAHYTKSDLAQYYITVARWILPELANRALTLVRCPNGCEAPCFFQKHVTRAPPEGLRRVRLPEKAGPADYLVLDDLRGLLELVQLGALELHTAGARADRPNFPDRLVLDLDPGDDLDFAALARAALELRELLRARRLESFVKTTGGKGLHVCVPLDASSDFGAVLQHARELADALVASAPDRYLSAMAKNKRSGKVFVDYLRNARGATFIAPYSTRRRSDASVAVPLHWHELDAPELPRYTLESAPRRLARLEEDPWAKLRTLQQKLPSG